MINTVGQRESERALQLGMVFSSHLWKRYTEILNFSIYYAKTAVKNPIFSQLCSTMIMELELIYIGVGYDHTCHNQYRDLSD